MSELPSNPSSMPSQHEADALQRGSKAWLLHTPDGSYLVETGQDHTPFCSFTGPQLRDLLDSQAATIRDLRGYVQHLEREWVSPSGSISFQQVQRRQEVADLLRQQFQIKAREIDRLESKVADLRHEVRGLNGRNNRLVIKGEDDEREIQRLSQELSDLRALVATYRSVIAVPGDIDRSTEVHQSSFANLVDAPQEIRRRPTVSEYLRQFEPSSRRTAFDRTPPTSKGSSVSRPLSPGSLTPHQLAARPSVRSTEASNSNESARALEMESVLQKRGIVQYIGRGGRLVSPEFPADRAQVILRKRTFEHVEPDEEQDQPYPKRL